MGTVSFQITYFDFIFFWNINFFSCFNNSFEIMMVFWKLLWAKKIENIWCSHIQNICCLSLLLLGRKFQIFFFYWEDGGNHWNLTRLLRPCTLLTLLEQFLFLLRLFVVDFIFYRSLDLLSLFDTLGNNEIDLRKVSDTWKKLYFKLEE